MTARIDWPRLLEDLAHLLGEPDASNPDVRVPCSQQRLANSLAVPKSTLYGWIEGSEPKHADGERLLVRWCALTGQARTFAPIAQQRSLSAARRR